MPASIIKKTKKNKQQCNVSQHEGHYRSLLLDCLLWVIVCCRAAGCLIAFLVTETYTELLNGCLEQIVLGESTSEIAKSAVREKTWQLAILIGVCLFVFEAVVFKGQGFTFQADPRILSQHHTPVQGLWKGLFWIHFKASHYFYSE